MILKKCPNFQLVIVKNLIFSCPEKDRKLTNKDASRREGPSPESFVSDENSKPSHTLFCRDIRICQDLGTFGKKCFLS